MSCTLAEALAAINAGRAHVHEMCKYRSAPTWPAEYKQKSTKRALFARGAIDELAKIKEESLE